jgi:hypothetical protein
MPQKTAKRANIFVALNGGNQTNNEMSKNVTGVL